MGFEEIVNANDTHASIPKNLNIKRQAEGCKRLPGTTLVWHLKVSITSEKPFLPNISLYLSNTFFSLDITLSFKFTAVLESPKK